MNDVDSWFAAQAADLVPSLVHACAFHSASPRFIASLAMVSSLMTSLDRAEFLAWEICLETKRIVGRHYPGRPVQIVPALMGPNGPEAVEIDDTIPVHRAMNRYLQCAYNDDRLTAQAVFATIDNDEDIDGFLKGLLRHAGIVLAQHETCGGTR